MNVDRSDARILTVTVNPALDVSYTVPTLAPDHKLLASEHRRDPGGGGINVAIALRNLGVEAAALVVAGGPVGEELIALVEDQGVEVTPFAIPHNARESIAIRDESRASQYRIVVQGPPVHDVERLERTIVEAAADAAIVVLSGMIAPGMPPDFYLRLVDRLDAVTIVDCPDDELAATVQGAPTVVKPSRRELASLVEWTPAEPGEIEVAARQVLDRGAVGALAVSLGPRGAVLVERDGPTTWFTPPPVDELESTVGAGDAMVAGLTAALATGRALPDAVRLGVAAGTATTLTPGTQLCTRADTTRLEPLVVVSTTPLGEPWSS